MNEQDLSLLNKKGISVDTLNKQLSQFKTGFPFLNIRSAATVDEAIILIDDSKQEQYSKVWDNFLAMNGKIVKFVPASGAASRMFKDLFSFLDADYNVPTNDFEKKFFNEIENFAFYTTLDSMCVTNEGASIKELIEKGNFKAIVKSLLDKTGMNYGNLPKGLLLFHKYDHSIRTPFMEHLAEGAKYACSKDGVIKIHFTVSSEHKALFSDHLDKVIDSFSKSSGITFDISFSEQKPSTDTVAADENNEPFREKNGELLFRPGGHGALIENLNDIDADVIFVKNIDNVVPDSFKLDTILYKKVIAGMLISLQQQAFGYLNDLKSETISDDKLTTIAQFVEKKLFNYYDTSSLSKDELKAYLFTKLNRPIRVCGMVKNTGEPGGGPYITQNQDGSFSPQILESTQIDTKSPNYSALMEQASHFNPVDLVCAVKNYKGEKFDLTKYLDINTGFISSKSKDGRELKALELPGLWNGAMSDWNTVFVEVPITTFNPVKTVNDLLRKEHQ